MGQLRAFDHIGITVADLNTATAFFVGLGLEIDGRTFVEGEFIDLAHGLRTWSGRDHRCPRRAPHLSTSSGRVFADA